jgi:hypothetical protein
MIALAHGEANRTWPTPDHRRAAASGVSAAYEQGCREMLAPHLEALLDKIEAAGWDRGQAASALMYLPRR